MKHRNAGEGSALTPGARVVLLVGLLVLLSACRAEPEPCVADSCDPGSDIDSVDADADGWLATDDCDDEDATVYPNATEVAYDGIDQDCDGEDLVDVDGDGFSYTDDCNDEDASVYPGATEVPYDGIDQDCDGGDLVDVDGDGDTYIEDCDDADPAVNPGAPETLGNGIDDDCDGDVDEVYVCAEGGDFATIQEGVDAAPDGAVVEICPGLYEEAVVLPDRSLTLVGLGTQPADVLVDADGGASALSAELTGATALSIENLGLTGSSSFAAELNCPDPGSELSLQNLVVSGLTAGTALLLQCDAVSLEQVSIRDGTNPYESPGWPYVYMQARDGAATVSRVSITDVVSASASSCLLVVDGDPVSVTNSVLARSSTSFCTLLIGYTPRTGIELANNTIADNVTSYQDDSSAIYLQGLNEASARNLRVVNNIVVDNEADWAFRLGWDWCNLDISDLPIQDSFQYNLTFGNAGGDMLNPANNAASDCGYWEEVSGCTCRDYTSSAAGAMYSNAGTNMAVDPSFLDESYHLNPSGPAVDAGDPAAEFNDADGSRNDLGAYGGPNGGAW